MASELDFMFRRIEVAHEDFIETLMRCGEINRETATKVKNFYLKKKFAKLDAGIGRISVKHGAFLNKSSISNAVALV